jgi:plasmid stabilization system protein ParE
MAQVRWTLDARQDLGTLIVHLGTFSISYAASFSGRILAAAERLDEFPRLGRMVPEYQLDFVRELIVDGYRVVYLTEREEVEVVSISHGSQDLVSRLGPDPRVRR